MSFMKFPFIEPFMQHLFQFRQERQRRIWAWPVFILAAGLMLAACAKLPAIPLVNKPTSTSQVSPTTGVVTEIPTLTPLPTAATPTVILVAPAGGDQTMVEVLKTILAKKTGSSGWLIKTQASLAEGDLHPGVRIVVALPPDPGLSALAADHSATQFVAVGITGLKPSANLSLIGSEGFGLDRQAFLAGYLSAMVTPDWRVGVINPGDADSGALIRDAFKNGARYFCGLCRPAYPPYVGFPQSADLVNPTDHSGWQSAADALINNSVQTIYIPTQISSPELLAYLDKTKINIVSGQAPSGSKYAHWLASISPDPTIALDQIWPDLLASKGGASLAAPLVITDINTALLSEGRMRLIQGVLDNLGSGQINPDTVPDQ